MMPCAVAWNPHTAAKPDSVGAPKADAIFPSYLHRPSNTMLIGISMRELTRKERGSRHDIAARGSWLG